MRLRFFYIVTLLAMGDLCGQTYPFIRYTPSEGLPGRHVHDVTIDHRGFLWVAVDGGLTRYDGREFRRIPGNGRGTGEEIMVLATDGGRWLFAGGRHGVRAIQLDRHAADRDDEKINRLLRQVREPVRALRSRKDGVMYIETQSSAWLFSPRDSSLTPCPAEQPALPLPSARLPGMEIRDAVRDCAGQQWIATDSGLVLLGDVTRYLFGPRQGLPTRNLTSVCIDQEGGIWCGTDRGLFHLTPSRFFTVHLADSTTVGCMLETLDRELYFGTGGHGVFRFLGRKHAVLSTKDGLPSNHINALHEIPTGELLIATEKGVVVSGPRGIQPMPASLELPDQRVRALYRAVDRSYWFATMGGLLHWKKESSTVYGTRDGLPSARITCLAGDAYGFVIVGTEKGLVRVRSTGGGTVQRIEATNGMHITALFVDAGDRLWIGTEGNGAFVEIEGRLVPLGRDQGLAGDNVAFIGQDNHGTVYLGTNAGVSVLPKSNMQYLFAVDSSHVFAENGPPAQWSFLRAKAMHTLTAEMGLGAGDLLDGSMLRDRIGRLWFGGSHGATAYMPSAPAGVGKWTPPGCDRNQRADESMLPLRVILSDLYINDTATAIRDSVVLGPDDRVLRARLLLPTYRNPGQLRILYRLQGLETAWHETTDGYILYSGLYPGSYTLEVQAGIGEGIWSDRQALLELTVDAPIEQRAWFWLLIIVAAVGLGILLQRMRTRWRMTAS